MGLIHQDPLVEEQCLDENAYEGLMRTILHDIVRISSSPNHSLLSLSAWVCQ